MRSGLVRETVEDPIEQTSRSVVSSSTTSSRANASRRSGRRVRIRSCELYKAREREIVDEVMAMTTIPDGLTRDEYLRRRLQSAREQLDN